MEGLPRSQRGRPQECDAFPTAYGHFASRGIQYRVTLFPAERPPSADHAQAGADQRGPRIADPTD